MQNVRITVNGTQTMPDALAENIELMTEGIFSHANGESILSYEESPLTGMDGTVTTFHVSPQGAVTLTRKGTVNAEITFEPGKKQTMLYATPYGTASLGVAALKVRSNFSKRGGELELEYVVDTDNTTIGINKFKVVVKR